MVNAYCAKMEFVLLFSQERGTRSRHFFRLPRSSVLVDERDLDRAQELTRHFW